MKKYALLFIILINSSLYAQTEYIEISSNQLFKRSYVAYYDDSPTALEDDLDLSVVCPSGERISFDNKISNCGGRLDIDMNETGNSEEPVENVFWEKDAPKGRYRVFVEHFEKHDSTDVTEFNILVSVEGNPREFKGQISSGDPPQEVCFFDVE